MLTRRPLRDAGAAERQRRELATSTQIDAVVRVLRGEAVHTVAREVGVTTKRLLQWRDGFLLGGEEHLWRLEHTLSQLRAADAPSGVPPRLVDRLLGRRRRRRRRVVLATAALATVLLAVLFYPRSTVADGWAVVHDGYGRAGVEEDETGRQVHYLAPMVSTAPEETHAGLKVSTARHDSIDFRVQVRTNEQLRQRTAPNPWETAWVVWHYRDDQHFYYLALKPNGWELGKRDPAYPGGQRFLASDTVPPFYFDTWYEVRVVQEGPTMAVWVDDLPLARFTDTERPHLTGQVGMYVEDAYAQFADAVVRPADPEALNDPALPDVEEDGTRQ